MTPETRTQNLILWGIALAVAVLLSFLSGIATHWPRSGEIDWQGVVLDVIQTVLTTVPLVAAGLGLPRLGKEDIAVLGSAVGHDAAVDALQTARIQQAVSGDPSVPLPPMIVTQVADEIERRMKLERVQV
jgi:hypothetical protein